MPRSFAVALAVLLLASSLATGQLPLSVLAPAIPSPTDVVRLIDTLTRKDSENDINAKADKAIAQRKLLIARTRVQVTLARSSRNWRGRVHVNLAVPTDVSYTVDLADIKAEHIRPDAGGRKLVFQMPMPHVEDVTPVLTAVKTDNVYGRARFRFLDAGIALQLQNTLLLADFQAQARKAAEEQAPHVRREGRVALQALLQRLLGGPLPGVRIEVE